MNGKKGWRTEIRTEKRGKEKKRRERQKQRERERKTHTHTDRPAYKQ
jgi:hypothetical protein